MKKKAVSILCMVAMSIGSLGTEVVCAAESDYALAKAPEDYKLTIYWPAPDTYFEEIFSQDIRLWKKNMGFLLIMQLEQNGRRISKIKLWKQKQLMDMIYL